MPPLVDNPRIDELLATRRVAAALKEPLGHTPDRLQAFFSRHGLDEADLLYFLTFGDFLYDYLRIEPAMAGQCDFNSTEEIRRLLTPRIVQEPSGVAEPQLEPLAEQMVALHSQAIGHDASFRPRSAEGRRDLLLDGQPFRVKIGPVEEVRRELARHPDVPLIVSADLGEQLGGVPGVYVDPMLHEGRLRAVSQVVADHLEVIDVAGIFIRAAFPGTTALRDLCQNEVELRSVIVNRVSDRLVGKLCGRLGEVSGKWVGSMLFGPAGRVIGQLVGRRAGATGGEFAGRLIGRALTLEKEEAMRDASARLAERAVETLPGKLAAWRDKRGHFETSGPDTGSNRELVVQYVCHRMVDEIAYYGQKGTELEAFARGTQWSNDPLEDVRSLLMLIARAGIHPHHLQEQMSRLAERVDELQSERRRYRLG